MSKRIGNVRMVGEPPKPATQKSKALADWLVGPISFSYTDKPLKGRGTSNDVAYVTYEADLLFPDGTATGFTLTAAIWEKHEEVIQAGQKGYYKYEDPAFFSAKCFHANTEEATDMKKAFQEHVGKAYKVWKETPEGKGEIKTAPSHKARPAGRLVSDFVPAEQYS